MVGFDTLYKLRKQIDDLEEEIFWRRLKVQSLSDVIELDKLEEQYETLKKLYWELV